MNDQILQELKSINKRLDEQSSSIVRIEQGQARTNTALEALAAGQEDIRVKMATKADIQDLGARLDKKLKSLDRRTENLELNTGTPNPDKH